MALTPTEQVNLLIGNLPVNIFYPIYTAEEVQQFLDMNGGNVLQAARMAAIAASMLISSFSNREITGDIHVYNEYARDYIRALENFIKDSSATTLPNGLMPYASGISWADICSNNANPDNVRSPLTKIKVCDTPIISGGFNTDSSIPC